MTGNWILKIYNTQGNIKKIEKIAKTRRMKIQNGCYVMTSVEKPKKVIKELRKCRAKYMCYRVEYERGSNYRKTFFSRTSGPYRCRYCNKRLTKDKLVVDHVVPVAKVQRKASARAMLAMSRCNNVNDIRNLAPACQRCNTKKSDKIGLWVLRGWLGKYRVYWALLYILRILMVVLMVLGVVWIVQGLMA